MDEEKLKIQIGENISLMRRQAGLTQAALAEKLNYSDKAVSKWERGESLPDVVTLVALARLLDTTVAQFLSEPSGPSGVLERAMSLVSEKALHRKADKGIILGLSSTLVWFVALLVFVLVSSFGLPKSWIAFVYAIPVNAIVLLSLRSAWRDFRWNRALISILVWGSLLSLHLSLLLFLSINFWKLYLLGIPGQIAIRLWFRMFPPAKKKEEDHESCP